ncbi:multidrug ABC transporter ATP-binding protein [Candidatus Epulonipiscioides gigas]|nr:multidrug ABC transporter ATP-binding protein [Epulopiscium sp. SCG-C07WGA-EpuloA2]
MNDTILDVKNIQKYYTNKGNTTKAIDNISFNVQKGEFLGIMGSSGSGKSTLLNCISTIDKVTSGNIYIDKQDISKIKGNQLSDFRGKKLGFIFQDFNLLDTLTAYENIALALSINNIKPAKIDVLVKQIAKDLNIQEILKKFPYHMSGGQQQRVVAARAMVTNPSLILADEPTGALDSVSAIMLLEMLTEINNKFNSTILMVTHDAMSASYSNRVLFLKDGQIFKEIYRGTVNQKTFFNKVLEVISEMRG